MTDVDLTEFFRYSRPRRPPCQVGNAREQLKPAERSQLDAAVETDANVITSGAIITWLKQRGHIVSTSAMTSHRRQTCTCHGDA